MPRSPRQIRTNRYIQEKKSPKCIFMAFFLVFMVSLVVGLIAYFSHYHERSTGFNASVANSLIEESLQTGNLQVLNKTLDICNGNKSYTLKGDSLARVGECNTEEASEKNKTLVKCKVKLINAVLMNGLKVCEVDEEDDLDTSEEEFELEFEVNSERKVDKVSVHTVSSASPIPDSFYQDDGGDTKGEPNRKNSIQLTKDKARPKREDKMGVKEIFGLYLVKLIGEEGISRDGGEPKESDSNLLDKCRRNVQWPCQIRG